MDKESAASITPLGHGSDTAAEIARVEHAYFSLTHERVSFDKLEQMILNVGSNNTVRFDHRTCFGINVIPGPPDLGEQPAF